MDSPAFLANENVPAPLVRLLQSLFEKHDEFFARGATFLLLDVNGEYRSAFSELPQSVKRRYLKLEADPTSPATAPAEGRRATASPSPD